MDVATQVVDVQMANEWLQVIVVVHVVVLLVAAGSDDRTRRRRSKYVRLPSGFTFPADAASNFQRDAYIPPKENPNVLPSTREGLLIAPPRAQKNDAEYQVPTPGPTADLTGTEAEDRNGFSSLARAGQAQYVGRPQGMTYAEYKQAMSGAEAGEQYPQDAEAAASAAEAEQQAGQTAAPAPDSATEPSPAATATPSTHHFRTTNTSAFVKNLHLQKGGDANTRGQTYSALSGSQFYQSIFGGKNGFSPLSFFLNKGLGETASVVVPVPIVVPPPPPPPPGPKCYTNPSGFLCCNVTLEKTMEEAYLEAKAEGISLCNVQKMATAVQEKAEKRFNTSFESIAAHRDFVAKINFAGDLNCKIEIDGKFILAYATPITDREVNIIDANSFFSGSADDLLEANNTRPTYIVYGPVR